LRRRKNLTIHIAHLNFTVKVRAMKPHPDGNRSVAWTDNVDRHNSVLYLPDMLSPGLVAHEVTHVLQQICAVRSIDFVRETEHMGYLMQYLVGKILGYSWVR
jgi:hypothetical protein